VFVDICQDLAHYTVLRISILLLKSKVMHRLLIYSLFLCSSLAFQFPFNIPLFKSKDSAHIEQPHGSPRIAIIGAGAGGSSAAFWISKAKEKFGIDVEIDVYERSDYIGGRKSLASCLSSSAYL
jgi:prenylcysteine oxidase/farnesylcysteine lyase